MAAPRAGKPRRPREASRAVCRSMKERPSSRRPSLQGVLPSPSRTQRQGSRPSWYIRRRANSSRTRRSTRTNNARSPTARTRGSWSAPATVRSSTPPTARRSRLAPLSDPCQSYLRRLEVTGCSSHRRTPHPEAGMITHTEHHPFSSSMGSHLKAIWARSLDRHCLHEGSEQPEGNRINDS
jgi:hypothetical protein